jgi:hypothetical protein
MIRRLALLLLFVAAALLGGAGATTAWREFGAFANGGIAPQSRFAALAAGALQPAVSPLSERLLLDACQEGLRGLYGRLRPAAERRAVATQCRDAADAVTAAAPGNAYGWYVGARAAAALGDAAGAEARLLRSHVAGPMEQWVAELRVGLVEADYAAAGPELRRRHAADLALLVRSRRGIAAVSHRYIADPSFRARITEIVEELPEEDQARFVGTVRRAAAGAAP